MRKLIFVFLCFYSAFSIAAGTWSTIETIGYSIIVSPSAADAKCAQSTAGPRSTAPQSGYRLLPAGESPWTGQVYWQCQYNPQPCDLPLVFNQITGTCQQQCEEKNLGSITTNTHGYLTCKSGCALQQLSDSNCVGISATGYCTADYKQTGQFCATTDTQPSECTNCGNETGTGGNSGGGSGGGDGGFSGGGGGGGSPNPPLPGAGGGGSGPGNSPNPPNTNGNNSGGLTQSELNQSLRETLGESSGGEDCNNPPIWLENPSSTVAQSIVQAWKIRCPNVGLNSYGNGKYDGKGHALNVASRLAVAKEKYKNKLNELQSGLQNSLHATVSGGGSNDCPTYEIFGRTITGGFCSISDFLSRLGGLFPAVASILAGYLILRRE